MIVSENPITIHYRIVSTEEMGYWIADQVGVPYHPSLAQCVGLLRNDVPVAGVLYEQWNGRSVFCHIAATHLTPTYLAAIFDYPFHVIGTEYLLAHVTAQNTPSQRVVEKMGFSRIAVLPDAHPEGDLVIYRLQKKDCRYLHGRYARRLPV